MVKVSLGCGSSIGQWAGFWLAWFTGGLCNDNMSYLLFTLTVLPAEMRSSSTVLLRLVHIGSIVRVVTGTDGRRNIKPLGPGEKKVRANQRQKAVQWIRKVRYREGGDSGVS